MNETGEERDRPSEFIRSSVISSLNNPPLPVSAPMATDASNGFVRINPDVLSHKLNLRGKTWSDLRVAASFDTQAKIKRHQLVRTRILQQITVQLAMWPVLEGAEELIERVVS